MSYENRLRTYCSTKCSIYRFCNNYSEYGEQNEYSIKNICDSFEEKESWNKLSEHPIHKKKLAVLYSDGSISFTYGIFDKNNDYTWTGKFKFEQLKKWDCGCVPVVWKYTINRREEKFKKWRERNERANLED